MEARWGVSAVETQTRRARCGHTETAQGSADICPHRVVAADDAGRRGGAVVPPPRAVRVLRKCGVLRRVQEVHVRKTCVGYPANRLACRDIKAAVSPASDGKATVSTETWCADGIRKAAGKILDALPAPGNLFCVAMDCRPRVHRVLAAIGCIIAVTIVGYTSVAA